jgi:hypothetical protein
LAEDADLLLRILYRWDADYVDRILGKWRIHDAMSTRKYVDRWPGEQEYMLDKFARLIPNFERDFESEIRANRSLTARLRVQGALVRGHGGEARKLVRESGNLFNWRLFLVLYAFSWFPASCCSLAEYLYRRLNLARLVGA